MFYLILLGLCMGSFVNAWVWRLHQQSKKTAKKAKNNNEYSILNGRSMCVECKHALAWYDLIPVISWLTLGGKCRYCKKPISAQYPAVELATAGLFGLSYAYFPLKPLNGGAEYMLLALWLSMIVGFMAMTVYDLRWMLLPDKLTRMFTIVAAAYVLLYALTASDPGVVSRALMGGLVVGGLFYGLFQVSGGKWIGGGDVKLGFMLGLLAGGPLEGFMVIFLASLLGTLAVAPLLVGGKDRLKMRIPFGPFLIAATIIVFLFSADIINWYQTVTFFY